MKSNADISWRDFWAIIIQYLYKAPLQYCWIIKFCKSTIFLPTDYKARASCAWRPSDLSAAVWPAPPHSLPYPPCYVLPTALAPVTPCSTNQGATAVSYLTTRTRNNQHLKVTAEVTTITICTGPWTRWSERRRRTHTTSRSLCQNSTSSHYP